MRLREEKRLIKTFHFAPRWQCQAPFVWVTRLACKSRSETYGVVQTDISMDDPLMISVVSFSFGLVQSSITPQFDWPILTLIGMTRIMLADPWKNRVSLIDVDFYS